MRLVTRVLSTHFAVGGRYGHTGWRVRAVPPPLCRPLHSTVPDSSEGGMRLSGCSFSLKQSPDSPDHI